MRRPVLIALLLSLPTLLAAPASAWSPAGHMTLGAIAYHELERIDPAALETVLTLLESHPHFGQLIDGPDDRALPGPQRRAAIFMRAARWADDVRQAPFDEYSEPAWHYVNFRYRPANELMPPRGPRQDGYLLWALEENARRLESDSDTVRALALTWLFHLITDLHQPLHDIALIDAARPDGDRGGNLTWVRRDDGETVNLHWYWDGLINRSESFADAARRAHELAGAIDAGGETLDLPTDGFQPWAVEGARVAVETAYLSGTLGAGARDSGVTLPAEYASQARETAERRGVLGALRLARFLADRF